MSKTLAITWIVMLCHVCVLTVVSKKSSSLNRDLNRYLNTNAIAAIR